MRSGSVVCRAASEKARLRIPTVAGVLLYGWGICWIRLAHCELRGTRPTGWVWLCLAVRVSHAFCFVPHPATRAAGIWRPHRPVAMPFVAAAHLYAAVPSQIQHAIAVWETPYLPAYLPRMGMGVVRCGSRSECSGSWGGRSGELWWQWVDPSSKLVSPPGGAAWLPGAAVRRDPLEDARTANRTPLLAKRARLDVQIADPGYKSVDVRWCWLCVLFHHMVRVDPAGFETYNISISTKDGSGTLFSTGCGRSRQ